VIFRVPKEERNQFIGRVLKQFGYAPHGRGDKVVLLHYIERMAGLSRSQVPEWYSYAARMGSYRNSPARTRTGRPWPRYSFERHWRGQSAASLYIFLRAHPFYGLAKK